MSTTEQGYWNGLPTEVRRVVGTVREHDAERDPEFAWWAGKESPRGLRGAPCEDLQGQRVEAVEVKLDGVNFGGGTIYLDDRDGSGWRKVTEGRGSPRVGHRELPLIDVEPRPDPKSLFVPEPSPAAGPDASPSEFELLRRENEARLGRIAARGVDLDVSAVFFDALLEAVFPEREKREAFLLAVEKRTAFVLEAAEKQISGLVIAQPTAAPPMSRAERRRLEREARR